LRTDLEVSRYFLFYRFETDQRCKKDSKNSFENYTQDQRNHVYFGFPGKYIVVTFRSHLIRAFSVFLEHFGLYQEPDGLEKNLKTDSDSAHQNQSRIVDFHLKTKTCSLFVGKCISIGKIKNNLTFSG
jgi:hypothetical protein